MTPTSLWLITGVLLFIAEALGATGIGLLFAAFGALATGITLEFGWVDNESTMIQFVVFFAATAASAALLWKPLQKFRVRRQSGGYNNMVGDTAIVGGGGIKKSSGGEVTWSGTIMKAELAADAGVDSLAAGTQAVIVDVRGTTLIVKPK